MGVRPAWGLFLRNFANSSFDGLRLSCTADDERPSVILIDSHGIRFGGTKLFRGKGMRYDVGLRNSSGIELPSGIIGKEL